MSSIEEAILKLDKRLAGVEFDFAFLGGSVLSLLVTNPDVDAIRVTKDVDVMMDIRTRKDFHKADRILEGLGFRHDTREDAPICRWVYEDVTVDVLPTTEDVLGWKSKWFAEALDESTAITVGRRKVRVVTAPYFVALKLEAFEDRGAGDFVTSTDFEDVICLFNGRATIVDEIAACDKLRAGLAGKFTGYLNSPGLEDAVEGFVQTEPDPEPRKARIMGMFKSVAALASAS